MRLPSIHPRKLNQALAKIGWFKERQNGGEYIKYKEGHPNPITVPYHGSKALKRGTLSAILRAAGISREEFLALLRNKKPRN
jgi:predicted RNA binding protein YcfA (HicA-like mRNA interferase family)